MAEGLLSGVVLFLGAAGFAALVLRIGRTMLRVILQAAEATAAQTLAEASARRGDLTEMHERREAARIAKRQRRIDSLVVLALGFWLVAPPFAGLAPAAYAVAAPLWVLPHRPVKRR